MKVTIFATVTVELKLTVKIKEGECGGEHSEDAVMMITIERGCKRLMIL